ncbi:hypothetical protein [Pseudoduganella sp. R-34]|uniref:hypothetical protein n=1 Tax=Pseudoduganella sp. R-34 TaxID=3404062 RepID=UPI003CEC34B1
MSNEVSEAKIELSWRTVGTDLLLLAYRGTSLVYPLIDYCLYLSHKCALSQKTIYNAIPYVQRFLEFLETQDMKIGDVSDNTLARFRESELVRVRKKANRSRSERAAKRTVNAKIRRIYQFLWWFQQVESQATLLIGPRGCNVRSALGVPQGKRTIRDRDRYPEVFRLVGEGSRHRTKYVANDDDVDAIMHVFLLGEDQIAQRNILMLEFAETVGMRRGSINSLRTDQFDRNQIDAAVGTWAVVPPAQKFGYENKFEIPLHLAYRVCDFIDSVVKPAMASKGWGGKNTEGRLFFSFKNGRPLRDQTISQIFGKAMDDVGVREHGANIHSLRRKYANDEIIRELDRRVEQGLDTSAASVAASVSIALGHSNPQSIEPYISKARAHAKQKCATSERLTEMSDLRAENEALKSQVLELKMKLAKRATR